MKPHKRNYGQDDVPRDDMVVCAGHFNATDPMCHDMCAFRVRCAIESRFSEELEMMEDLFGQMAFGNRVQ